MSWPGPAPLTSLAPCRAHRATACLQDDARSRRPCRESLAELSSRTNPVLCYLDPRLIRPPCPFVRNVGPVLPEPGLVLLCITSTTKYRSLYLKKYHVHVTSVDLYLDVAEPGACPWSYFPHILIVNVASGHGCNRYLLEQMYGTWLWSASPLPCARACQKR